MQYKGVKVKLRDGLNITDKVRQDMHTAWLDLQNLHRTQPGTQYKCAIMGKGWKISSLNGKDLIELLGYYGGKKKGEKKDIKVKPTYDFIPGICIIAEDDYPKKYYIDGDLASALISVCMLPTWQGRIHLIAETAVVEEPLKKWPDVPPFSLLGLTEYGISNYNDYDIYDDRDDYTTISTDTGFNPLPYKGYSLYDGAMDYGHSLPRESYNITGGISGFRPDDGVTWWQDYQDEKGADYKDDLMDDTGYWYDPDPAENNCNRQYQESNLFVFSGSCGGGHLMFNLDIQTGAGWAKYATAWIGGMCWPGSPTEHNFTDSTFFSGVMGSAQHRVSILTQTTDEWVATYDIVDRAAGDITIGTAKYSLRDENNVYLTGPCSKSHSRDYSIYNPSFDVSGMPGAYVPDTVAATKPNTELQDKYCFFYTETIYEQTYVAYDPDDWHLSSAWPTYETYWEDGAQHVRYNNRTIGTVPGGTLTEKQYLILYANINGERVEIDRADYTDPWYQVFVVTDAHILECLGSIYYMYAYCYKEDYYNLARVRYGYFKDIAVNHVRSEVFTPVGITDSQGRTCPHHAVYGSENFETPLYGIGKCAGFLRKKITEYI